jgi:hypothetical protein
MKFLVRLAIRRRYTPTGAPIGGQWKCIWPEDGCKERARSGPLLSPSAVQQAACARRCTIWWIAPCMTVMS